MKIWKKSVILSIAVLAFGAARMPFESGLARDMRAQRLLPGKLNVDTVEKIGQTSAAVAFGGLRTLVATFLNLRAYTFFAQRRWADVGETYDMIVDLAPHTRYYWDAGYWHQAYNAASYYVNDSELPPVRRRAAWRESILKGRAFLERGIRNNPDDWVLLSQLGFLCSDPNKFIAFKDLNETFATAADAYQKAAMTGQALGYVPRFHLYALARVQGREAEALALARSMYAEGVKNHTPTFLCLLFALEAHHDPDADAAELAVRIFGSPEKAYQTLSVYWQRTSERLPVYGVAKAMASLEDSLNLPGDQRVLLQALPPPRGPDQWFRN